MMFVKGFTRKRKTAGVPIYLNVYDLTSVNGYAYWLGLGIYHSGVQVHGVEYAYGAHDNPTSGIYEGEPKLCPGFRFRKSILIGRTELGEREVRALMDSMAEGYTGITYNLISKNCNHFCDDVCTKLTGNGIPRWVNRLAGIGFFCNCMLPAGLHVSETEKDDRVRAMVRNKKSMEEEEDDEEEKEQPHLACAVHRLSSPPTTTSPSPSSSAASFNKKKAIVTLVSASSTSTTSNEGEPEKPVQPTIVRKRSTRLKQSSSVLVSTSSNSPPL